MRTGAAAGHQGYFHEAVRYDSDEEFLAVVVPFLRGGIEAGEPTFVALGERTADLVRRALPAGSGVEFLSGSGMYARPTAAIRSYRRLLADRTAAGAAQIRIIGELPPSRSAPPGTGGHGTSRRSTTRTTTTRSGACARTTTAPPRRTSSTRSPAPIRGSPRRTAGTHPAPRTPSPPSTCARSAPRRPTRSRRRRRWWNSPTRRRRRPAPPSRPWAAACCRGTTWTT